MRWALLLLTLSGCLSQAAPDRWDPDPAIHPGMRLYIDYPEHVSQCTAGFLFTTPDNGTLFLSVSSHCLHANGSKDLGDPVYGASPTARSRPIGTIAFDGWGAGDDTRARDFALIQIADRASLRAHATAAVPFWGSPHAIATSTDAYIGTPIVAYGNSTTRTNTSHNPTQGWLTAVDAESLRVRLDRPALPGDSGGPLLTLDGQALGMLHAGESYGTATSRQVDIFTPLDTAIAMVRAEGDAGVRAVRLATWGVWVGVAEPIDAASGPPSSALPSMP